MVGDAAAYVERRTFSLGIEPSNYDFSRARHSRYLLQVNSPPARENMKLQDCRSFRLGEAKEKRYNSQGFIFKMFVEVNS
jgi:hypothetical protein